MKLFFFLLLSVFLFCGQQSKIKLLPPPNHQIYLGAFPDFGGSEDEVTTGKIRDFEALIGRSIVWACFSNNWYNGITYPREHIHAINQAGVIPLVRLMPRSAETQGVAESHFSMQHIIDGDFDGPLHQWARDAKQDGIPILVDFAVEANGDWFGWSGVFNGGSDTRGYGAPDYPDGPERYRDAYRHIIDIFREEGVYHITWVFHFNLSSFPQAGWNQPKYYYPGDDYIDWIGFSLYGAQEITEEWEGLAFSTQLAENYRQIYAVSRNKPIAVFEFGVTDGHPDGDKAAWWQDAFETILSNPYVSFAAVSPWHENWENEDGTFSLLGVDSSDASLHTFRQWAAHPTFIDSPYFSATYYGFLPAIYGLLLE